MRISQIFIPTKRGIPKEAKITSHQLLLKGGFIAQTGAGLFSLLPLGFRVFEKIENIIREELEKVGCQEILMPVVQPARLWKESGRYFEIGPELLKFKSKDEEFVLSMTAEEVVTDILRKETKFLPLILNQIQTKFRDEPRPRGGLLRLREFTMQDAYSFDKDEKGLDLSYGKIKEAYKNIFRRMELKTTVVSASTGIMGGKQSEEFMVLSENGEDRTVLCSKCDYASNLDCAQSIPQKSKVISKFKKMEEVKTPKMKTVLEVAEFLNIDPCLIIKSIVYKVGEKLILVLIRGDLEIVENKLKTALGIPFLEKATEEDCQKRAIDLGFVGPVGLDGIEIYADYSLKLGGLYVVGANKPDTHLVGVSLRDFKVDKWLDLAEVKEGDACQKCGGRLKILKSIELAHLFKLGTRYSESMKAYFLENGKKKPILMGCYGIGLERLMAAIVETHHDENGIIWPKEVAPFLVYLMGIVTLEKEKRVVEEVYNKLIKENIEVLYDDRDSTAGVKFMDADLIGCPLRLTISRRSLERGCLEIKERSTGRIRMVKLDRMIEEVKKYVT